MALNNRLAKYLEDRKKHDSYWVESAKIDFSFQLEIRRKIAKLSYKELAEKLGTSASYLTKVFRGDSNLTIESMVKLARATGSRLEIRLEDQAVVSNPQVWFNRAPTLKLVRPSSTATSGTTTTETFKKAA